MSPTACNPLPLAEMQRVVPGTQYSMWNINQIILEDKQCKLKIIWKQQENSFLFSLFLKTVSNVALFSRTKFYLELTYEKQIVHFIFNEGCYTLTIYNTKVQNLGRPRTRPSPYYLTERIYHPSKVQTLRLGRYPWKVPRSLFTQPPNAAPRSISKFKVLFQSLFPIQLIGFTLVIVVWMLRKYRESFE